MITRINTNTSNKSQNFGNFRTASETKDALMFALMSKDPVKKLTTEQAVIKIDEAINKEDKIGQKMLQMFKEQITGTFKKPD